MYKLQDLIKQYLNKYRNTVQMDPKNVELETSNTFLVLIKRSQNLKWEIFFKILKYHLHPAEVKRSL